LPSLLDLLSGHVRAGHSLSESLSETVPLLPAGIREEMAWVLQQNRLGTALPEALVQWEERIRSEETSLLVRPLRAAIPGGGNIVDLLERTRDILRLRIRAAEKLRSMTAQARLQALVLTLLPPAFAVALSKVDSGFFPNLLGTPQGKAVLAIAFILQLLGWISIRKILSVRP
jgi:tight adherence protein B